MKPRDYPLLLIALVAILSLSGAACASVPVASFSAAVVYGPAPLSVQFTDSSLNGPVAWVWSFGDGGTSAVQNPSHSYVTPGSYTVTLTVTNADGTDIVTRAGYITAGGSSTVPVTAFAANVSSGTVPLPVSFSDLSTNSPTVWAWSFGDGSTSAEQNPSHRFTGIGTYTVTLTATNAGGSTAASRTGYITVNAIAPTASFSANATSGISPFAVRFSGLSTNSPASWAWSFGDGTTSSELDPVHIYMKAGSYTVMLTVTNPGGSTTVSQTGYITVNSAATLASFYTGTPSGVAPLSVRFVDSSTNSPTSWAWSFGDGSTSTDQNPTHIYRTPGSYTVTLTTINPGGSSTTSRTGYVTVSATTPAASFLADKASGPAPLLVQFTDSSLNSPTSWTWFFGDGGTFSGQNPAHTYTSAGTYTVELIAANSAGSNTSDRAAYISVGAAPAPAASFTADAVSGAAPFRVRFTDTSTNSPTLWSWSLGDGTTSSEQNPTHIYPVAGSYSVTLIAANAAGSTTAKKNGYITITGGDDTVMVTTVPETTVNRVTLSPTHENPSMLAPPESTPAETSGPAVNSPGAPTAISGDGFPWMSVLAGVAGAIVMTAILVAYSRRVPGGSRRRRKGEL